MSNRESIVKHIYFFFSIASDVFTFYILTIGILTLYAFSADRKLLEILNLTMTDQFLLALYGLYIIIKSMSHMFFLRQMLDLFNWFACSFVVLVYLSFVANDIYKIMAGVITCFLMKILIVVYVKIRKYSTECIGIRNVVDVEMPMNTAVKFVENQRNVPVIHEAGHAVMAYLQGVEVFKVSSSYLHSEVITVLKNDTYEDVKKSILISYAGAIAEEILVGCFSTGSIYGDDSDFHKATEQIKAYIVMSNSEVSKTLLEEELYEEIILLSKKFYREGMEKLTNNKQLLEMVSDSLLKKRHMSKDDFIKCVENIKVFH